MSSETAQSTLTVYNNAKFPLACLAIGHYQVADGSPNTKDDPFIQVWDDLHLNTFKNDKFTTTVPNLEHSLNYWVVAWNCVYDPAVYYLVAKEGFWHKFEEAICKTIDTAIGAGVDAVTGSPVGTVWSTAANTAVSAIFNATDGDGNSIIENKIDSDLNSIDITLNADRLSALIQSGSHSTNCSPHSYLLNDYDAPDKGYGLQIENLGNPS